MPTRILLSSSPENLRRALSEHARTATVEAEYGDVLVEGSVVTLAHHGPRKGNPCPCLHDGVEDLDAIGLSHVDLDSVGGALALSGDKTDGPPGFWEVAAQVDVRGAHRLDAILEEHERALPTFQEQVLFRASGRNKISDMLHAWWAWSKAHRCFAPSDGSVADVTAFVEEAREALSQMNGELSSFTQPLLEAGRRFQAEESRLNEESFLGEDEGVIMRASPQFCNHLYRMPDGRVGRAVVALDPERKSVTVSLADPVPGVSCRELVRAIWGVFAGGHDGIAGSPRGEHQLACDLEDAKVAARWLRRMLVCHDPGGVLEELRSQTGTEVE